VIVQRLYIWLTRNFWLLFLFIILPSAGMSKPQKNMNPLDLYSNDIMFNVIRNDEIIGRHLVTFSHIENDKIRVKARLNLQVNFLSFPIYKFDYRSEAVWHKGKLKNLYSNQNDDGDKVSVKVFADNDSLVIKTQDTEIRTNLDALPTNHWNVKVLEKKQVINTLTGELSSVVITGFGKEKIKAHGKFIYANKYKYTGDIQALVWYSDSGNWVKMQFEGKDGSTIKYECVECGLK